MIGAAIEAHAVVQLPVQAQPAHGDVFEGLEQLRAALEKQIPVRAVELHHDFGVCAL